MKNNNANYFRVYNQELDLLYETSVKKDAQMPEELIEYINKSEPFLEIDNIMCYRLES